MPERFVVIDGTQSVELIDRSIWFAVKDRLV
jgi:hypothetical protein